MRFILLLLVATLHLSCGDGGKHNTSAVTTENTAVQPEAGIIHPELTSKIEKAGSYSLYIPKSYTGNNASPLMVCFDPSGKGMIPLEKYKALADKYGYILAGSNAVRNGLSWQETRLIATSLLDELTSKLKVDSNRIYTLGFSGGGRAAHGVAISDKRIRGAIACGAASPAGSHGKPRKDHLFMAVVGNRDLNYSEVRKYDLVDLAGHDVKHSLLIFDGKHEWPPADVINEAILWMELNEMRKHPKLKNEQLINENFAKLPSQLDSLLKNDHPYEAYLLAKKTINFYDGLANLAPFFDAYKSLGDNKKVDLRLKEEEERWKREEQLKQEYARPAQLESPEWWAKETKKLNEKAGDKNNADEAMLYGRLLEYLSLFMYSQLNAALEANDFKSAERYSEIYRTVDPDNSEAWYLSARLAAMESNGTRALRFLEKAIENGFGDLARLESDKVFDTTRNSVEYRELSEKLRKKN